MSAASQTLPPGVAAQPCASGRTVMWECQVCGEDTECEGSYLLQCDLCCACVHMDCCGVDKRPDGGAWLCDTCELRMGGLKAPPACALCPVVGGPMKRTTDGRWAHLLCAMWVPETGFQDPVRREPIEGCDKVTAARRQLKCQLCRQQHGAPIQCAGGKACFAAFHPLCARNAGLPMVMQAEEEQEGGHGEGGEGEACGGSGDTSGGGGDGESGGKSGSGGGSGGGGGGDARRGAMAAPMAEGTHAGSHRLLAFCRRHADMADAPGRRRIFAQLQQQVKIGLCSRV
jgi:hypothetical protein